MWKTTYLTVIALAMSVLSAPAQTKKANVVILATGGTIAGAAATGTQSGYTSGGLVGVASYGHNDFYGSPPWKHTTESEFDVSNVTSLPRVDIIFASEDMSPDLIDAAVTNGAKGIVIAGVGNGNMNKGSLQAAEQVAKQGVIVVRSSRVPTGTVGRNVEVKDDEMGFVASGELNPQKARILLSLALLKPHTAEQIQEMFNKY